MMSGWVSSDGFGEVFYVRYKYARALALFRIIVIQDTSDE